MASAKNTIQPASRNSFKTRVDSGVSGLLAGVVGSKISLSAVFIDSNYKGIAFTYGANDDFTSVNFIKNLAAIFDRGW